MRGKIGFGQKVGALATRGLSECKVREWMGVGGARADRERDLKLYSPDGVAVGWGRQDLLILPQRGGRDEVGSEACLFLKGVQ